MLIEKTWMTIDMRIFSLYEDDIHSNILRDLLKRSVWVKVGRYQDKDVPGDEFDTKEILNYTFMISDVSDLNVVKEKLKPTLPWADEEFEERVSPQHINPGSAWESRRDVWEQFLHDNIFDYTYNERIRIQLRDMIDELKVRPMTRQAIISIWDRTLDNLHRGKVRVPCSMYYQFLFRNNKLHIIYNMRSCDIMTHYKNDIYLAIKLLHYVAREAGMEVGDFYMNIGNLHIFKKDIPQDFFVDEV